MAQFSSFSRLNNIPPSTPARMWKQSECPSSEERKRCGPWMLWKILQHSCNLQVAEDKSDRIVVSLTEEASGRTLIFPPPGEHPALQSLQQAVSVCLPFHQEWGWKGQVGGQMWLGTDSVGVPGII